MIIYGVSVSPFVRKARAFAAEKGLELTLVPAGEDPAGFRQASPFGKIPALRDGDFLLSDSSAIVGYFEKTRPQPNLIPDEPRAHAQAIWFDEFADTIVQACVAKIFYHRVAAPCFYGRQGNAEVADQVEREEFPKVIGYLEQAIPASGFLVDNRFTLADISVASSFASLNQADCRPDASRHPKAVAYLEGIWARPSFAALLAEEGALLASLASVSRSPIHHPH